MEEETISLQEIFATIKKRFAWIILIAIAAVAISAVVSYFVLTPTYKASTQILVTQNSSQDQQPGVSGSQIQANLDLINTYSTIIKSPRILDKVNQQLNLDKTTDQLSKQITVSNPEKAQIVNIDVENEDPAKATTIANTTAQVFQKQIPELMNIDNVNILSKAEMGDEPAPVSPNPTLNMVIAFVVGIMIGVGLAFLLEYLDTSLKTEDDIERQIGLPVLGTVTEMNGQSKSTHTRTARSRVGGETFES